MSAATVALIVNASSGAGRGQPDAETLRGLFLAHGVHVEASVLEPGDDLDVLLDAALARNPSSLIAAGGDGTINAVATRAIEADISFGVLPLGTLNHFARDLGIPEESEAAVQVIVDGHTRCVDVGTVNDRLFLNNASIGLYATIVVDREQQQRRLGRGKWTALCKATLDALRHPDTFETVVRLDGRELRRRTPFIFVGNNDYIVQGPEAGQRASLDDGTLSIYVLHPRNAFGLLWVALRTLLRGVSGHKDLDAFSATEFTVEARESRVDVARDGEVCPLDTPLRFAVKPRALRVFAPLLEAG